LLETKGGYFIRHLPANRHTMTGCTILGLLPGLPLIGYWIVVGHEIAALSLAVVLGVCWFILAIAPQPYGITLRSQAVEFEQRNLLFVPQRVELTRDQLVDLWLERQEENFATLYLNCLCGRAQDGLLTVRLLWGPWAEVREAADRVATLLGIAWQPVVLSHAEVPLPATLERAMKAMSSVRRVEGAEDAHLSAEAVRQILAARRMLLLRFGAEIDPKVKQQGTEIGGQWRNDIE
jgi:hypothetical protein